MPEKVEISDNGAQLILTGAYYIDLTDVSSKEWKIVSGGLITGSPYDYEMIYKDKKYKAKNGQIFTGQQLIEEEKLPLNNWGKAQFRPINE